MKKLRLTTLLSYLLIVYVFIWLYFLIFNWDLFVIELNTYLGFSVIKGYPFIFFFFLGFLALLAARIHAEIIRISNEKTIQERIHRVKMLEKELEIVRIRSEKSEDASDSDWGKDLDQIYQRIQQLNEKIDQVKESTATQTEKADE